MWSVLLRVLLLPLSLACLLAGFRSWFLACLLVFFYVCLQICDLTTYLCAFLLSCLLVFLCDVKVASQLFQTSKAQNTQAKPASNRATNSTKTHKQASGQTNTSKQANRQPNEQTNKQSLSGPPRRASTGRVPAASDFMSVCVLAFLFACLLATWLLDVATSGKRWSRKVRGRGAIKKQAKYIVLLHSCLASLP